MYMVKIPSQLKPLFWDIDFSNLNFTKNSHFIIKRVLDRGNTNNIRWLNKNYSKNEIIQTVLNSRDLSQKTANFWSDIYGLDQSKILCLQKPYSPTPFGLSS